MPTTIPLWPAQAPGSENWQQQEAEHFFEQPWPHRVLRNVVHPTLTVHLPDASKATGTAVIICPGGAYHILAIDHEGTEVAEWLNERGIAAVVLKYRVIETHADTAVFLARMQNISERIRELLPAHWPLALADGQRALQIVRDHADAWGIHPNRVGMLGFSAGAHLVAGVAIAPTTQYRPNFVAPIYGGMRETAVIPEDAPPLFTAFASNDPIAVQPCFALYHAWEAAGRSAELHCYAIGGHGFGMVKQGLPCDGWIDRFGEWLASLKLTNDS